MYAYIPAKDVARARKFYEGTLGFKVKQITAGGVVYEFGRGTACLSDYLARSSSVIVTLGIPAPHLKAM